MSLFSYRDYRHLFAAQVVALFGTGLTTVALGLLAYQLAGAEAGAVLGTALAIKMIAYVTVAPIAAAHADRAPSSNCGAGLEDLVTGGTTRAAATARITCGSCMRTEPLHRENSIVYLR
jgi:hypothetical protein